MNIFNKKYGRNVKITEAEPPSAPPKQPNFDMDNIQYDKEMKRKLLEMEKIKIDSEIKKNSEEWIWIEGYKGTDRDMKCRNFQYELNKTYSVEEIHRGNINIYDYGFHLCLDLKDVFRCYNLNLSNRFFKVKALVRREDKYKYEMEQSFSSIRPGAKYSIGAKEIILFRELTFEELKQDIQDKFPKINNELEWNLIKKLGIYKYYNKIFINKMKEIGYSDIFSQVLFDEYHPLINPHRTMNILDKAIAYSKENLSKDMIIYLLMKDIRK
ncbi:DUF7666 domain-containing protein [Clostridioides difficile]|uniref:DUF7666 domain-containing protein n=1 Tax=Clostridioides difficile TaxID=1496 RepID=UPI000D542F01|nr:hypothetical protein [Clostridioides difficile]AWH83507.1 hypothetical protein DDG63_20965 [Clostridioides difficile]MCT8880940.1 hypothetical protein [Clostridioides difficile]MCT8885124.1 hypothetical protein [Clostridioides difficile]MDB3106084.1 hypothetical protein [Clostridioides difficile]MDB3217068.1 hypothetical protein [Clostridioides difficile]